MSKIPLSSLLDRVDNSGKIEEQYWKINTIYNGLFIVDYVDPVKEKCIRVPNS